MRNFLKGKFLESLEILKISNNPINSNIIDKVKYSINSNIIDEVKTPTSPKGLGSFTRSPALIFTFN